LIGRALFSDSDFDRLLEKLWFKHDGFVVLAKVEWHRASFIRALVYVTNLSRPADRVVAFYNKRRTCEQ